MNNFINDDMSATKLCAILDAAVARLAEIASEPVVLAECPDKFNDAFNDDLWYAVQSGGTVWEQSHFFEGWTTPLVKEHTVFSPEADPSDIVSRGANVESKMIPRLRSVLRELQLAGWRSHTETAFSLPRRLLALVLERSQPWFVLETPNVDDGEVFVWDEAGFARIGMVERLDQAVGSQPVLTFESVDPASVHRLSQPAQHYFAPVIINVEAQKQLIVLLSAAVETVLSVSDRPVALRSSNSRDAFNALSRAESFCESFRRNEGELRRPSKDGVWPPYRPTHRVGDEEEMSDLAKGLHTALGRLEESSWRETFASAFGETLPRGTTLALFVDTNGAAVMRDNAAFRVTPTDLEYIGVFDYPNCHLPNEAPVLAALSR